MKRIFCIVASVIVIVSSLASTASAVSYTDLRPTYTLSGEYSDYVSSSLDSNLMLRSNCYGYALRLHYGNATIEGFGYGQLPGEFYDRTGINMTYLQLYDYYEDNIVNWQFVYRFVTYDAAELGYSVTTVNYYSPTEQFTPPTASSNPSKRLIALVENADCTDYHFYIQHDDNKWSHKDGSGSATANCWQCGVALTNSNISQHIHHRMSTSPNGISYQGNVLLFWIDANGSSDRYHSYGFDDSYRTPVSQKDIPGDYLQSALYISDISSMIQGDINHVGDEDCYVFNVNTSGAYNFYFYKSLYTYIVYVGEVTDGFGTSNVTTKAIVANSSSASFTKNLQTGKIYYIKVTAPGLTSFDRTRYNIFISN